MGKGGCLADIVLLKKKGYRVNHRLGAVLIKGWVMIRHD